jgi:hypothetical protein
VTAAPAFAAGWMPTGNISDLRWDSTATLLPNGRVIVVGGSNELDESLASAEVYNPQNGVWSKTGNLQVAKTAHAAASIDVPACGPGSSCALAPRVLVTGGHMHGAGWYVWEADAELYNPNTGAWTGTQSMTFPRSYHTMTVLHDGNVLAAGGTDGHGQFLPNVQYPYCFGMETASAEVYFSNLGAWKQVGSMHWWRLMHTATLLPDGKVLVAGGCSNLGPIVMSEVFDPATWTWSDVGNMNSSRALHTATLINVPECASQISACRLVPKVLVTGGIASYGNGGTGFVDKPTAAAELYDPQTHTWTPTHSMAHARYAHTATLLPDGRVLVTGGGDDKAWGTAEVYNPLTGTWSPAPAMITPRLYHTATLVNATPNCLCAPTFRVVVEGGNATTNQTEVFTP